MVTNMKKKPMKVLADKASYVGSMYVAKKQLKDWVGNKISDEEYTLFLARDERARTVTNNIAQGILNPTPLNSLKTVRTNDYLDIGMGFSAFWDEMRRESDTAVDDMSIVDSKIMNLDLGLDKDISPHMRKGFLAMAGIPKDDISTFVTLEDYYNYEAESMSEIREYHMGRLGYQSISDMDENARLMLDSLVDDSLATGLEAFSKQVEVKSDLQAYGDVRRYDELYGLSAQEMYELFGDDRIEQDYFPEYVERYTMIPDDPMYTAVSEYHHVLDSSIEYTQEYLDALEAQMDYLEQPIQLNDEDLEDLHHDGPSLSDEDLENLASLEEYMEQ